MTRAKICGLRTPEDARVVRVARPDLAGTIFAPNRKRTVTHETAAAIRAALDEHIPLVGVFLHNPMDEILQVAEQHIIQYIQLHGDESADFIRTLKTKTPLPVIKAFRIETADDIAAAIASPADYILLDSGNGGTGQTFDWSLLCDIPRPWFLAGGITPDNAFDAVRRFRPYCIDVSSGVETDERKNPEQCRRFTEAVRQANKYKEESQ